MPARAQPAEATVELKAKYPVGNRYLFRMSLKQDQTVYAPGATEPMKHQFSMVREVVLKVLKTREGGGHELELEFAANQADGQLGEGAQMQFDSKQAPKYDASHPIAAALRKLTGGRLALLLNAKGKVDKVEDFGKLAARLGGDISPDAQSLVSSLLSEEIIKQTGAGVVPLELPDKPVKVGDRWLMRLEMPTGQLGILNIVMQYVFRGWETREGRKCALLESMGTIATKSGAPPNPTGLTVSGGQTSGKEWFDPELGMIVDSQGEQRMRIKVGPQGQGASVLIQTFATNKLVEVTTSAR